MDLIGLIWNCKHNNINFLMTNASKFKVVQNHHHLTPLGFSPPEFFQSWVWISRVCPSRVYLYGGFPSIIVVYYGGYVRKPKYEQWRKQIQEGFFCTPYISNYQVSHKICCTKSQFSTNERQRYHMGFATNKPCWNRKSQNLT